jgi:ABC-type sugar transport system permease subunit
MPVCGISTPGFPPSKAMQQTAKTSELSRKPPRLTLRQQDKRVAWLLIAPSLIIILGVALQPILTTFYLSFFDVSSGIHNTRTFIGLKNYSDLLADSTFWATIGRTFYFTVVSVGLELILGLAIAQLIHSHPPGWRFLRFSLIIPWAVPTVVNGSMWRWIYSADFGALNGLLMQLGLIKHYVVWLIKPSWAMNLVILADLWHVLPFVALILQAALATLPVELDEAAMMDGANSWQRFRYVRLPLLRPAILVVLIVRTVDAFRVFDIVYIITRGGPAFGTITITYLTYLETFSYGKLGSGAALSFMISIFTIIMAIIYIRILYRPPVENV